MALYLVLLTFFTSFLFTYISLFNSKKFSHFFFLLWRSGIVILYCAIYGLIGIALLLVLKETAITLNKNSTQISGPAIKAFIVGLTAKGIAEIKFFDIMHQGVPFPIGFRSITQFLDMRFDKELDAICLDKVIKFMKPYKNKYDHIDIELFKQRVLEMLSSHPAKDKAGNFYTFIVVPGRSKKEILEEILKEFGKRTLITFDKSMYDF